MSRRQHPQISAVATDLDGTLLDQDGTLGDVARVVIGTLREKGIPVILLTSKTEDELRSWLETLDAGRLGAFENGAGIVGSKGTELLPAAIGIEILHGALEGIAHETGIELKALTELTDGELERLTGLRGEEADRARRRRFDLPFLAPPDAGEAISSAMPSRPDIRLTRGGIFWHLLGRHTKGDALELIRHRYAIHGQVLGLGDAPNDLDFLSSVEIPAVVPTLTGVAPELRVRLPHAAYASHPGGEGWAELVEPFLPGAPAAR